MADSVTFTLSGREAFDRVLAQKGRNVAKRTARRAITKASRMLVRAIKANVRIVLKEKTGSLLRSIKMRVRTFAASGNTIGIVGAARPEGSHAVFHEFGTGPRKTKKGYSRGAVPARPIVRPAFDANKDEALRIIAEEIRKELARPT